MVPEERNAKVRRAKGAGRGVELPGATTASRSVAASQAGSELTTADHSNPPPLLAFKPEAFRLALRRWFQQHARDLPWRGIHDPYATWLSEIMLQQTRVATVIDRYREFLQRFPTLGALARADEADVLALWSGLGYYRRARMLHRGAQFVLQEFGGKLPPTSAELRTLPGVGEYTAAAIASIAFGESIAVLDGNVERVLLRLLGLPEDRSGKARTQLVRVAQGLVPPRPARAGRGNLPGDHNQAMMELGATVCLPRSPLCLHCPVISFCRTRGEHTTTARDKPRSWQSAYLLLLRKRGVGTEVLLERRAAEASLMPGMLELPPVPTEAGTGREPVLRLRHSITDTNYYVEIFAEGAAGVMPQATGGDLLADEDPDWPSTLPQTEPTSPDAKRTLLDPAAEQARSERFAQLLGEVFEPEPESAEASDTDGVTERLLEDAGRDVGAGSRSRPSLRTAIVAAPADLQWHALSVLYSLPLTGLTRKVLQRLGLMPLRQVRLD